MTSFAAVSEYTRKLERDADSQDTADLAPQSHCTVLPLKLTSRGTAIKEPPPDTVRNKSPRELLAASPQRKTLLSTTFERSVKRDAEQLPTNRLVVQFGNQKENMWGQDEGASCDRPSVIDAERFSPLSCQKIKFQIGLQNTTFLVVFYFYIKASFSTAENRREQ